jgi:hypothetical protein
MNLKYFTAWATMVVGISSSFAQVLDRAPANRDQIRPPTLQRLVGASNCDLASSLGFRFDGSDETALLDSTLTRFFAANGGCLAIDNGKSLRIDGQITFPADAANAQGVGIAGRQPTYAIIGAGNSYAPSGYAWMSGGSTLDLRYHGSEIAALQGGPKLLSVGHGTLIIENLNITTGASSDCATFFYSTGTVVRMRGVTFQGTGCNGGVVLGGTAAYGGMYPTNYPVSTAVTGWFQGYGSFLSDVYFFGTGNAVAPALLFQGYVNGVVARNLWIGSGGSSTAYMLNGRQSYLSRPGPAIVISGLGTGPAAARANTIDAAVIEIGGYGSGSPGHDYTCGIALHNAEETNIERFTVWDGGSGTYAICGDSTATKNHVAVSVHTDGVALVNPSWSANNNMPYRTIPFLFSGAGSPLTGTQTQCSLSVAGGTINRFFVGVDAPGSATFSMRVVSASSYTGISGFLGYSAVASESLSSEVLRDDSKLNAYIPANTFLCVQISSPSGITSANGFTQIWQGQ